MKKTALLFMVFFACQCVIASTGWNSQQTQEIRQKIASNNIYGPDSGRVTVRNYDRTKKMIESSMQGSANIEGSKAIAKASMKTPVNMGKVASTTMKRLARGGVAGMLGGAAVQLLVDGVGWIIDSGDNVIKKPVDGANVYNYQDKCIGTGSQFTTCLARNVNKPAYTDIQCSFLRDENTSGIFKCTGLNSQNQRIYFGDYSAIIVKKEEKKYIPVTETELANKIDENTDSNSDTIVKSAYTPVDSSAKKSPDLSDVLNGLNDTIKDIVNDFKNVLNSDNPTSTGKTDSEPTIIYNNTVVNNNNTTTNTDGSTSITTGTSDFQIPAWCEWAFDMCEWHKEDNKHQQEETTFWEDVKAWFDWTKEEPDQDDQDNEEPQVDDKGIFSRTFDTVFSLSSQCPSDLTFNLDTEYLKGTYIISLRWLCIFFSFMGYPLVLASHCTGIWILYETVIRKEIKW